MVPPWVFIDLAYFHLWYTTPRRALAIRRVGYLWDHGNTPCGMGCLPHAEKKDPAIAGSESHFQLINKPSKVI